MVLAADEYDLASLLYPRTETGNGKRKFSPASYPGTETGNGKRKFSPASYPRTETGNGKQKLSGHMIRYTVYYIYTVYSMLQRRINYS